MISESLALPGELQRSLGFNLDRAAVLFRRELLRVLSKDGLQPEQWQVLLVLRSAQTTPTQQAVADLILADKHAVSRMLTRMERDGWIQRQPSPDDSRSQHVVLTPKARRRVPAILQAVREHFSKRLAPLSNPDREQLIQLLTTLRTILRDRS